MVFKLRGRLLNMETRTLSPGAPETRRGFFLSASASVGALFHFFLSESSFLMRFHARGPKCQL